MSINYFFKKFQSELYCWSRLLKLVRLKELVWAPRKGSENESKTIHNRKQNTHLTGSAE